MPLIALNRPAHRHRSAPRLEPLEERHLLHAGAVAQAHSALQIVIAPRPHVTHPAGVSGGPLARLGHAAAAAGWAKPNTPIIQGFSPLVAGYPAFYIPSQIRTALGLNSIPNQGQGTTIVIVDAFHNPNMTSDLALFSSIFGLPQMTGGANPTFLQLQQNGSVPNSPPQSWALEEALDVEWAHSVAPLANITVLETTNNSFANLIGVGDAAAPVFGQVVSNSFGGGEFSSETSFDPVFANNSGNTVYLASTGDNGAPGGYPAFSPYVVGVGGTSLYTASTRGIYARENGWSGSGGGISQVEPTPAYQSANGVSFGARSIPDISTIADPATGVAIIDQYDFPGEFVDIGGTSLASPVMAGIVSLADSQRMGGGGTALGTLQVLGGLYNAYNSPQYGSLFHDITVGNNGFAAGSGYDLVTGIGSPKAPALVPYLATLP
jgi:subtilase family serine protease